jgi:hypothetical protein
VLGTATGFLLLVICWLAGVMWWCITGSQELMKWSAHAMRWFGQPERSVLGILAAFVLLALVAGCFLSRVRLPRIVLLLLNILLFCTSVATFVLVIRIANGVV